MRTRFLLLFALAALLVACHSSNEPTPPQEPITDSVPATYNTSADLIALYHSCDSLLQIGEIDTTQMRLFVENAFTFAESTPTDTLTPHFMLYAGIFEMQIALSTPSETKRNHLLFNAIEIFNHTLDRFPHYAHLPYCYYYKGQIYENMRRLSDAENEYRELVHRFPNSALGKNIAAYLKARGFEKSPEEIVHGFRKK